MDDLISRAAAIEAILGSFNVIKAIEELHAVDAAPVVHGRWGEDGECSKCGFQPWYEHDIHTLSYCPNCGAKMDKEDG